MMHIKNLYYQNEENKKYFYFLATCWLYLLVINSQAQSDSIKYSNDFMSIVFYNNGKYVYEKYNCDICFSYAETPIKSFGKYIKYKNKAYYLFSESDFSDSISIKETKLAASTTIHIVLQNPFEERIKQDVSLRNAIFYQIRLVYNDNTSGNIITFNEYYDDMNNSKYYTFWDSIIEFSEPSNPIKAIILRVYPTDPTDVTIPFKEYEYYVNNPYSNYFEINLPNFLFQSFCQQNYFFKEVLILDKNNILMNDHCLWKIGTKSMKNWRNRGFKRVLQQYQEMIKNEQDELVE